MKKFDTNDDGYLDREEVKGFVRELFGIENVSDDVLRIIFIFDADDDGNIDKGELLIFIKELFKQHEDLKNEKETKVEAFTPIECGPGGDT